MNEETIEYRLTQIEAKLDQVTNLLSQTQQQEFRISALEKKIDKSVDRWLNPLVAAIVSGFVAFILVKLGVN
jgi:hypothetical protein